MQLRISGLALLLLAAALSVFFLGCEPQAATTTLPATVQPKDYGPVGDFALIDQSGQTLRASDLRGSVWIAGLIFTRCGGPCPRVMGEFKRLQDELTDAKDLRLVTISVDPEHDRPEVLQTFGSRFGADPKRWSLLTGEPASIAKLVRSGLHLAAAPTPAEESKPGFEVTHSTRLCLIDREGLIRGYFSIDDALSLRSLRTQVRKLLDAES